MVRKIFGGIILLAVVGFFAWSGIAPLFAKLDTAPLSTVFDGTAEKGDYVKGDIIYCTPEVVEVTHTVSFIPAGWEHYFFIYNDETDSCVAIKADKNWYEKEYLGGDSERIPIKGAVKSLDFDTRKELEESFAYIHGSDAPEFTTLYIDMQSDRYGIFTIISIVVMIALVVCFMLFGSLDVKSVLGRILMFMFFVDIVFMLHILMMV